MGVRPKAVPVSMIRAVIDLDFVPARGQAGVPPTKSSS